jgi:hypothetical protein
MSTNYDSDIRKLELQYQLEGQRNAMTRVELECLRLKQKLETYDETRISLQNEISITEEKIAQLQEEVKQ